ncbi:MAG: GlsB/YeaQ/YmgE family stress response membrane protein [Chloroflexota bacterium]
MTILAWLVLGLIAGWIASLLVGGGYGLIGDIIVGIIGAFVGGWLGSMFLGLDVTGLNFTSIALAVGGAVIVLLLFRALSPGRRRI